MIIYQRFRAVLNANKGEKYESITKNGYDLVL